MIIGIAGKMGTGKTTLASILADLCDGRRVSFADALRDEVQEIFGVPMSMMADRNLKEQARIPCGFRFVSPRELLQWWGEERRRVNCNYWVDQLMAGIDRGELVLVDDVRYRNEAEAIRQADGLLVRLEPYAAWPINPGAYHRSETDLDDWGTWDYKAYPEFGGLGELARYLKARFQL